MLSFSRMTADTEWCGRNWVASHLEMASRKAKQGIDIQGDSSSVLSVREFEGERAATKMSTSVTMSIAPPITCLRNGNSLNYYLTRRAGS